MARIDVKAQVSTPKKKVEKPTIHDVYILDASGSMGRLSYADNKASNALRGTIENLQASALNSEVITLNTVCIFSYGYKINLPYVASSDLPEQYVLRDNWYSGMTALYDAIGFTMNTLREKVRDGESVNIKIFTDGCENDSTVYNAAQISTLIKEAESKGWTIAFIGTKEDVKNVQIKLAVKASNSLVYDGSAKGFQKTMSTTRGAMASYQDKVVKGEDTTLGFYKSLED